MIEIDYTVFFQIANFLVLIFILNIVLYKPIRKILGRRADQMGSLEETISDFQDKFIRDSEDLQKNMTESNREGFREKEDLKGEGLEAESGLLKEAASSAEEKISEAKEEIQGAASDVRQSLEAEVAVFSKELAEKILGRSI